LSAGTTPPKNLSLVGVGWRTLGGLSDFPLVHSAKFYWSEEYNLGASKDETAFRIATNHPILQLTPIKYQNKTIVIYLIIQGVRNLSSLL
jgi:hypothetical protein